MEKWKSGERDPFPLIWLIPFPGRVYGLKVRQAQFPLDCNLKQGYTGETGFSAYPHILQDGEGVLSLRDTVKEPLWGEKPQQRVHLTPRVRRQRRKGLKLNLYMACSLTIQIGSLQREHLLLPSWDWSLWNLQDLPPQCLFRGSPLCGNPHATGWTSPGGIMAGVKDLRTCPTQSLRSWQCKG